MKKLTRRETRMPRRKSMKSIETRILAVETKIRIARERYDQLCAELTALQEELDTVMGREVMEALKTSRKTYKELMTFLGK